MLASFSRIFLLATLCFGGTSLHAQCNYERNEVDRFTKSHVVEVKAKVTLFGALIDRWFFRQVDDSYFLDIHSSTPSSFVIGDGAHLYFLLANDSVVIATSTGLFSPSPQMTGNMTAWIFDGTYELDRADMERRLCDSTRPAPTRRWSGNQPSRPR